MKKRIKKVTKKLNFDEKLQIWSDRIGLVLSIILIVLTGISLIYFFR